MYKAYERWKNSESQATYVRDIDPENCEVLLKDFTSGN